MGALPVSGLADILQLTPPLLSGNALEKAGGRDFLEGVKELRKAHGPLEVAAGRLVLLMEPGSSSVTAFTGEDTTIRDEEGWCWIRGSGSFL